MVGDAHPTKIALLQLLQDVIIGTLKSFWEDPPKFYEKKYTMLSDLQYIIIYPITRVGAKNQFFVMFC